MDVADRVAEGPRCLVAGGVEDLAETRDSPEGWLHGEEAAAVGRVVHGAARVRAQGAERLVGLDDDRAAGGGAAREVRLVNGVVHHLPVVAVQPERAHAHLVHICGAKHDGARIAQTLHRRGVNRGNEI